MDCYQGKSLLFLLCPVHLWSVSDSVLHCFLMNVSGLSYKLSLNWIAQVQFLSLVFFIPVLLALFFNLHVVTTKLRSTTTISPL